MSGLLESVSFTAAREWDEGSGSVAINVLCQIPPARRYVTGGSQGGDAFLGLHLARAFPQAWHVVILPANRSQVDPWWELHLLPKPVTVIEMPFGSTYKDRNQRLVDEATAVYGLPAYPEKDPRSLRSGTWQTIRLSRRARKLISWCCVQPPYAGQVERWPSQFPAVAL